MRRGDSHKWKYSGVWDETKTGPGRWRFKYRAGKGQKARPGVGRGSKYVWDIRARQYARKTRSGHYETVMVGTKRLRKASVKRRHR